MTQLHLAVAGLPPNTTGLRQDAAQLSVHVIQLRLDTASLRLYVTQLRLLKCLLGLECKWERSTRPHASVSRAMALRVHDVVTTKRANSYLSFTMPPVIAILSALLTGAITTIRR